MQYRHRRPTSTRRAIQPLILLTAFCLLTSLMIQGCGGGGGGTTPSGPTGSIRGIVYAPDGTTPVSGAIIYIPGNRAVSRAITPPEGAVAWTTSASDGSFVLNNVPEGEVTVNIVKDEWTETFQATVQANKSVTVPKTATTFLEGPPNSPFPGTSGGDNNLDGPPSGPFTNKSGSTLDYPPGFPFNDTVQSSNNDLPPPPPFD